MLNCCLLQPLQALTSHLPATYRICNPNFNYESSRNPRRVLTKPSKGVKNDGYDNEDSDYILYVNDILGSEEAGHKYVLLYSPVQLPIIASNQLSQKSLSHPRCSGSGYFWTGGQMSEFEDTGSRRRQGYQEQNRVFQPKHDGSISVRSG